MIDQGLMRLDDPIDKYARLGIPLPTLLPRQRNSEEEPVVPLPADCTMATTGT